MTENSDKLDITFSFDTEVMASTAYRNFFTALVRQNLSRERKPNGPSQSDRLSVVTIKPEAPILESDKQPSSLQDAGTTAIDDGVNPHFQQPTETTKERLKTFDDRAQSTIYAQALWDYEDDDRTCLNFHKGDVIQIITQLESGWWDGVLHGIRGWFPSNYCKLIQNGERLDDLDLIMEELEYELIEEAEEAEKEIAEFWLPQATPDGELFYFNTLTGEKTFDPTKLRRS